MKEKTGKIFRIAGDNQPVAGCTISKEVYASGQDYIIPEIAKYNKDGILLVVANTFQNLLTQHAVTFLCQVLSVQATCLKYIISILDYSQ